MDIRPCPVCQSEERKLLFHQQFSSFSAGNLLRAYDVVACNRCGCCFADKIPPQKVFDVYYRDLSKYEGNSSMYTESRYDRGRFATMVSFLQKHTPDPDSRVVEIGCANGLLLAMMREAGFRNLTGIDPSPACAVTAGKQYGINVLTHALSDIPLPAGSVDLLILVGVLEHVRDLTGSLERLRQLLSDKGRCFIAVPDASQYHRGEDAPFQEFSVEHINFFGPESLHNLFAVHGFKSTQQEQVLIEVNHKTITPVLMMLFEKSAPLHESKTHRDTETEANLTKYIAMCRAQEEQVKRIIDGVVDAKESIAVWGTGAQTLRLLENSRLKDADIRAFVDSNPKYQGKLLQGVPVISPAALKDRKEAILISTRPYQAEIEAQIREQLKLNNKVIKLY